MYVVYVIRGITITSARKQYGFGFAFFARAVSGVVCGVGSQKGFRHVQRKCGNDY